MQKAGISGLNRPAFRIHTTDSKHDLPIAPRLFKTEEPATHPVKPNTVWVSDISYIPTDEGTMYLGTYMDVCTRKKLNLAALVTMREQGMSLREISKKFISDPE
jgi:transposase InsO family protein